MHDIKVIICNIVVILNYDVCKDRTIFKMNMEKITKQEIVKSAEAVKRKLKMMRDMTCENEQFLETVLKPLTNPLNQMAGQSGINVKMKSESDISPQYHSTPKKIKLSMNDTKPTSSHDETVFELNRHCQNEDKQELEKKDDKNLEKDEEHKSDLSDKNESDNNEVYGDTSDDDTFESVSSLDRNFSSPLSFSAKEFEDVPYGVRLERGKLMLGKQRVYVSDKAITVNASTYEKTKGLMQLLFEKLPNLDLITEKDIEHYKFILNQTNAHRRDFDSKKPIKSNRGAKYLQIIKPLFKLDRNHDSTENLTVGKGLGLLKKVKPNIDYVYWDDPNELVDRLKLLIASREAGNTGLDNEIISIIEELQENGIIS